MLDPAAIADPAHYEVGGPRATSTSGGRRPQPRGPRLAQGHRGRTAAPPLPVPRCRPTREGASRVFEELAARVDRRRGLGRRPSVSADPLVAYNLLKSFLSSHRALLETVDDPPHPGQPRRDIGKARSEDPAGTHGGAQAAMERAARSRRCSA